MIGDGRFFRRQQRVPDEDARVLPLINIVFLLLIFFLITGHLSIQAPFELEPVQSASGSHPHTDDLTVFMGADGRLAIEGESVTLPELEVLVGNRPTASGDGPGVRLQADGRTEAIRVVEVMERLRASGIERLELLTLPDR
ncbi:ExbD/TolR family protein [Thioalkalivibrio sp.]|uniref:ExbD/TolR family protein n=1 Tax=Thioalkalivibrio sp. TaxID=2093813 RepID=UPI0035686D6B